MNAQKHLLLTGALVFTISSTLLAAPVWPADGDWLPILVDGSPYIDALNGPGDVYATPPNPDQLDLVGGIDSNSAGPFPTGYIYTDADNLMVRMRVDGDPTGANSAWIVFLNTDPDDDVDWVLSLDSSGDNQVELVAAAPAVAGQGNPWEPVVIGPTPHSGVAPLSTWSRFVSATAVDGSEFDGDEDFFVDMAFPMATFLSTTGLAPADPFGLAFATSANHNNINKDLPDSSAWGYPPGGPVIPEPATLILLAAGLPLLLRIKSKAGRN
jgi:large repetitive protein